MNRQPDAHPMVRDDDSYLVLICSGCGGDCTHHEKVEIFNREEDSSVGTHAVIEGSKVDVDDNLDHNPSGRRHGILIHYWCEQCETKSVLTISQHKGWTLIENKPYAQHILRRHL